jgi:hypothetical protein
MNDEPFGKRKKIAVCRTCTARLVTIAYKKKPSFRLLREPLRIGMSFFAWVYRVDPDEYEVRNPGCKGCIRFYKTALKESSPLFRRLNDLINPFFDRHLEKIVTAEEVLKAKDYAFQATAREFTENNEIE